MLRRGPWLLLEAGRGLRLLLQGTCREATMKVRQVRRSQPLHGRVEEDVGLLLLWRLEWGVLPLEVALLLVLVCG